MTDEEIKREFIRVAPSGRRVQVAMISWNGPHTPSTEWVNFRSIPENTTPDEIEKAMNQALARKSYFLRCQTCKQLNPLGWMHDDRICQGCAERDLGVDY